MNRKYVELGMEQQRIQERINDLYCDLEDAGYVPENIVRSGRA